MGYAGSLISFLTIKVNPRPYNKIEQLEKLPKDTKIGTYGFGVDMGKISFYYFGRSDLLTWNTSSCSIAEVEQF